MKKEEKYYRVTLYNPFEESDLEQDTIVVVSDNEGRELLTNKKVFMCDVLLSKEDILSGFINQQCELIGGNFQELNIEFVSKFLKFTPRVDIDNMVNNINKIEDSIGNSIRNDQNKLIK